MSDDNLQTPWIRARKLKSTRQEERIGEMEGGRRQANSGRLWRWKRDGVLHTFLIEARTTDAGSYRIEKDEFQQLRKQAFRTPPGLLPAMQVDIQDLSLIVLDLSQFQDIMLRLIDLEAQVEAYDN